MFFIDDEIQWCISDEILEEYKDVLKRDKFAKYLGFTRNAESLLEDIELHARKYTPEIKLSVINDTDDNKFLELAVTCNADFIITGNTNDFTMSKYENTMIITPREYWEKYR